ncbi:helix-turn-helix domain-containing protein [Streptomyces sp. NPDC057927]
MILNLKIREILESKNMTQQDLSELSGVRRATISEMCNNQRTTISKDHLVKIAKALNITDVSELLQFTDIEI